jgi:hypothetical protein
MTMPGEDSTCTYLTAGTLLVVLTSDALPVERVPSVEDLDFLRDMRRMTQ